jgi:outer membrane protein OmpA-like peptidoglycan-associated protein
MLKLSTYLSLATLNFVLLTPRGEAQQTIPPSDKVIDVKTINSNDSKYQIIRTHLPTNLRGPQANVSRGIYVANFGSREGIQPGSIFRAIHNGHIMGILSAIQVGRDTTGLSIVRLLRKDNSTSSVAIEVGYKLQPEQVLLETIYFKAGELDLSPKMHERLRMSVRFVRSFPLIPLFVEGHTDAIGDAKKNLLLSEKRAKEVSNYLNQVFRIPLEQLRPVGYGETRPVKNNSTVDGRYKNRRVDIQLRSISTENIDLTTPH